MLNGAALVGCAVFSYPGREYVLIGLMLFLPLLDRGWSPPAFRFRRRNLLAIAGLALAITGLVLWRPQFLPYALSTLLLAALPEEWFFRAYFMTFWGDFRGWVPKKKWRAPCPTSSADDHHHDHAHPDRLVDR